MEPIRCRPTENPRPQNGIGRPPRERDFQRQYRRKPDRCQRSRVSGRIISLRVERGAWSVAYTVAWSIAVIAWSIAAVIACSVAAVIACSIAVMSVPVMVATIPHALAYREIARFGGEIGHGQRLCRYGDDAVQRGADNHTDRESFHGAPPIGAVPVTSPPTPNRCGWQRFSGLAGPPVQL